MNVVYPMSLRHFMNIVEGINNPVSFDAKSFFQHLNTLVLEIRGSLKHDANDTEARSKLELFVKQMMRLVKHGKLKAQEAYSEDMYREFVNRVEALVSQSGIHADAEGGGAEDETKSKDLTLPKNDAGEKQANPQKSSLKSQAKWQVLNLAIKRDANGSNDPVGVAKQDLDYYIFQGAVGGKYSVKPIDDYSAAQKHFYDIVHQGGYTEISPGAYAAVRKGEHLAPAKSHFTPLRHDPLTRSGDLPPNARVWR